MSKTSIPAKVVLQLWHRSGGRCQFRGCNEALWRDEMSQAKMNRAYIAHIIADSPGGPRGNSELSPKLAKEFSNLMLLCPTHHKLVDDNPDDYSVELLQEYKQEHEKRIEYLTGINADMKTHLLFFLDNIGDRKPSVNFDDARTSVLPRYPTSADSIKIDLTQSPYRDHESSYFTDKQDEISRLINICVRQRSRHEDIKHLSIFAIASMPLLIHFGYELGDTIPSDVYQYHRDTNSWKWQPNDERDFGYTVEEPDSLDMCGKTIALNLSLSGVIHSTEIDKAMKTAYCTYRMSIANPSRDYLKSKEQMDLFRAEMKALLRQIRETHGPGSEIHLFPAIPVSVAICLGQLLLPKSDPPIHIYENNQRNGGGFRYALTIPRRQAA